MKKAKPKQKIETIAATHAAETEDDIPAGIRLAYVKEYVSTRNGLYSAVETLTERIRELKDRRKKALKALEVFNRRRPDEQPDGAAPLLDGLDPTAPAGSAKIEISLESGKEAALTIISTARRRLTPAELEDYLAEFGGVMADFA